MSDVQNCGERIKWAMAWGSRPVCAVNRADALRGFEVAIWAFDYRVQGADELVEKLIEHLVKVQRAALGVCQVGRDPRVIGQ